jgi:hypothetical protein
MKRIPLTQGQFALVDDSDYKAISKFKWHAKKTTYGGFTAERTVYNKSTKKCTQIKMHRFILGLGADDKRLVDHRDFETLNNQRWNIRPCSVAENVRHRRPMKGASSRYKGVYRKKGTRKWNAYIHINGKQKSLGYFVEELDAAAAYDSAATFFHQDFVSLNIPKEIL